MGYATLGGMAATHHNLAGLARVSTKAQDAQLQRDALAAAGCARVFEEKVSTRNTVRPGLAAALDSCGRVTPSWCGSSTALAAP